MSDVVYRPARTSVPEARALLADRRRLARRANGSGFPAMRAWAELEVVESQLRRLDPDGEWRTECDLWDGKGWRVTVPSPEAAA